MDNEQISKSEFKARALEFLRQVEVSGKSVVITDRGRPTVEIRRYRADQREPLEILKGSVLAFKDPLEPVATDDWEALD
jgi:antitoxin (DNA-binding transcriptional repressor) of toxin-antitoxin stability system